MLASLLARPLLYGLAFLAISGALGGLYWSIYRKGEKAAVERIEDANRKSEERANEGGKTVDDCYRLGRTWDRATGVCVPPGQ